MSYIFYRYLGWCEPSVYRYLGWCEPSVYRYLGWCEPYIYRLLGFGVINWNSFQIILTLALDESTSCRFSVLMIRTRGMRKLLNILLWRKDWKNESWRNVAHGSSMRAARKLWTCCFKQLKNGRRYYKLKEIRQYIALNRRNVLRMKFMVHWLKNFYKSILIREKELLRLLVSVMKMEYLWLAIKRLKLMAIILL